MEFYSILIGATVIVAALALVLYSRRRDAGLVLGMAGLYYWTLFGAWSLVLDKSGGFSGKQYQYLEHKLFPVMLDRNYMLTLALYSGFLILIEITILVCLSSRRPRPVARLVLRHDLILLVGFLAAAASFLIIRNRLADAWGLHTSAYLYTRLQPSQWFTLHQVLNRVALIPPAIGLAVLAAGRHSRDFANVTSPYTVPGYMLLAAAMAAFTLVLGNKNEVLTALLTGFLAYVASARQPNWIKLGLVMTAGLWFLSTIDFFRGAPLQDLSEILTERLHQTTHFMQFLGSSNEAFAAHFSLYGVLASGTPPRFGYSLYSLACSLIPRVLWRDRPPDIYIYYVEHVGAIQNQGYSIHHATGWYLNFGYPGIALGAIVLGLLWVWCLNARQRIGPRTQPLYRMWATIAPWVFVAGLPPLIRAGPEGYKGMFIESGLVPVCALAIACRGARRRRDSPGRKPRLLLLQSGVEARAR